MSNVFFFRLHKLRRQQEQENERRQLQQQRRLSSASNGNGKRPMRTGRFRQLTRPSINCPSLIDSNVLTMVPGRLFERPATMDPSDSLDFVALQIPRYFYFLVTNPTIIILFFMFPHSTIHQKLMKSNTMGSVVLEFTFLIFNVCLSTKRWGEFLS